MNVFRSLRFRFLATVLLVVVISVTVVSLLANESTTQLFAAYVQQSALADLRRSVHGSVEVDLQQLAREIADAHGVEVTIADPAASIVAASDEARIGQQLQVPPTALSARLQLAPAEGAGPLTVVVAGRDGDSPLSLPYFERLLGETVGAMEEGEAVLYYPTPAAERQEDATPALSVVKAIDADNAAGATLLQPPATYGASQHLFRQAVNRAFLTAVVVALLLALPLAWLLSQRVLRPLAQVTAVAQAFQHGRFNRRVQIKDADEIGVLGRALNAMADGLQREQALRRQLVGDIAHELRTPLANIFGYLEAVEDGLLTADEATLRSMLEEAALLSRLVDDLQELALAEAGELPLDRRPVALPALLRQALDGVRPLLQQGDLTLTAELAPELPALSLDPVRMGQVLRNLLQNAIIHTPPGGRITVTARGDPEAVTVAIEDTGPGIAPEHLPHVFKRFYRVDPSRSRSTGGRGLGLAIVKALVEMHGGEVYVASEVGRGTSFWFTLPR